MHGKTQDRRHHFVQRDRGPDFMIGRSPQQRLNGLDLIDNAVELFGCLAAGLLVLPASRPIKI
jgi:hypothetical protein